VDRPDPNVFPSERPSQGGCGASWPDPLTVDGKIPGVSFGHDYTVDLAPVAPADAMRRNEGLLSWDGLHEGTIRGMIEEEISNLFEEALLFRDTLGTENYLAINNLIQHARAKFVEVDGIHKRWSDRRYPLKMTKYNPQCSATSSGPGIPPGGALSQFDRCPTAEENLQRVLDRDRIVELFVNACHFVRCAQFGMWRVKLYRDALRDWKNTPQGGAPDDLAPTPPSSPTPPFGSGDFAAVPGDPVVPPPVPPIPEPPPFPSDFGNGESIPDPGEPDPPELPDPVTPEDDEPSPTGEGEPAPTGEGEPAPTGEGEPAPTGENPTGDGQGEPAPTGDGFGGEFEGAARAMSVAAVVGTGLLVAGGVAAVYFATRKKK